MKSLLLNQFEFTSGAPTSRDLAEPSGKRILWLGVALYLICVSNGVAQDIATNPSPESPATSETLASPVETVQDLLAKSSQDLADGEFEQALRAADAALQLDSHNASVYEQRASIYMAQKLWNLAGRDYTAAAKIDPTNAAFRYKLGEIKFLQKSYDEARPHFVTLQGDSELNDLAAYKVLLCDLFSGHDARAAQDLAGINRVGTGPCYYFGNAAWAGSHGSGAEANKWISSAAQIYDSDTIERYFSSLQRIHPTMVTFTTKSGACYVNAAAIMETKGLSVRNNNGWITVPLDQLPDDLSPFPAEMRAEIADARRVARHQASGPSLVSFTTRPGKHYEQAQWTVEQAGVRVLTTDGWITVPFDQLPDDLSTFPAEMQRKIAACHKLAPAAMDVMSVVSFTTKQGKCFDRAKASMAEDGIRVLTESGWITVPFSQVPDDVAPFPAEWRSQIQAKGRVYRDNLYQIKFVSFTTRNGKSYDQVRASIEDRGLRVLGSDGWVLIPFSELPDDLSFFPQDWRDRIKAGSKTASDESDSVRCVSFSTKNGKLYDQVRALMEDSGLRVLTSDGWITIAIQQLPDDLSVFPEKWRTRIAAKQHSIAGQSELTGQIVVK